MANETGLANSNRLERAILPGLFAEYQNSDPGVGMQAAPIVQVDSDKGTFHRIRDPGFIDDGDAISILNPISDDAQLPLHGLDVVPVEFGTDRFGIGKIFIPRKTMRNYRAREIGVDQVVTRRLAQRARDLHTIKVGAFASTETNYDSSLRDDFLGGLVAASPIIKRIETLVVDAEKLSGQMMTHAFISRDIAKELRVNDEVRSTTAIAGAGQGSSATMDQLRRFFRDNFELELVVERTAYTAGGTRRFSFSDVIAIMKVDPTDNDGFLATPAESEAEALGDVYTWESSDPRGTYYGCESNFGLTSPAPLAGAIAHNLLP